MPRAIQSLLDQTFKNWICEVHNDCPGDPFPSDHIASLNDPRFLMKDHAENMGGTSSFNLAFTTCEEAYVSILEDDNWWEPSFLEEMIRIMENNHGIDICWSNMRVWQETADGNWEDTGKDIWPANENETLFYWPDHRQAMGALHSNGAMLYRGQKAGKYRIPPQSDLDIIEGIRERSFDFPICLSGKVLANFAQTKQTARSSSLLDWTGDQVMLLGSFIQASGDQKRSFQELLLVYRKQTPTPVATFFLVVLYILKDRRLLASFNIRDWFHIAKWMLGNGLTLARLDERLQAQHEVYQFLLEQTADRYKARSAENHEQR